MSVKGNRYVTKIYAQIMNRGPLHIGTGEQNILLEESSGMPYMPATGIAGAFRSYAEENYPNEEIINECFGNGGERSRAFFYDSIGDSIAIEVRPSLKINRRTGAALIEVRNGDKKSGHKFDREFLGEGHKFNLRIELFSKDDDQKGKMKEVLYRCINALNSGHIRLGGFKTSGAGEFKVLKVEESEFDLHDKDGLFRYLRNGEKRIEVTNKILEMKLEDNFIEFRLDCIIDNPFLTKGISSNESGLADSVNIRNSRGDYIIPGSGIKGILRSQCRKITDYLKISNELIELSFGNESGDSENKVAGNVYVADGVINNAKDDINYNRIKIDKFTGGTFTAAKFVDKPILGEVEINIKYKISDNKKVGDAIQGMLIFGLRDIAVGSISLGGGRSVGRGRMKCRKMYIETSTEKAVIDFEKEILDNTKFINTLIKSFLEYKGVGI